jgi:anion-transporting  ArsA/GET3 family ATPase
MKTQNLVGQANAWIRRLNRKDGWDVYLVPDDPSLNQLERLDEDLRRLNEKVSANDKENREERMRIINARQQVRELLAMYRTYDSITVPINTRTNNAHAKEA